MPRVGIQCPIDGARIDDATCLACRAGAPRAGRHCDFSYEMLAAMMDGSGRATAYVSASGTDPLCARQEWLMEREPYWTEPGRGFAAARGTMGHTWMQSWPQPGAIYEQRFQTDIPGYAIPFTGQLDKLWPHLIPDVNDPTTWEWTIEDGKSKEDDKIPEKDAKRSNIYQLNSYHLLVWEGSPQQEISTDAYGDPLPGGLVLWPGVPARLRVTRLLLYYFSMSRPKQMEAPIFPEARTKQIILDTMKRRTSPTILPVTRDLDPRRVFRDKETGAIKGYCHNWCPVKGACVAALLDEDDD